MAAAAPTQESSFMRELARPGPFTIRQGALIVAAMICGGLAGLGFECALGGRHHEAGRTPLSQPGGAPVPRARATIDYER
jgi:hypothetical protein